jgi:hypothetical protein
MPTAKPVPTPAYADGDVPTTFLAVAVGTLSASRSASRMFIQLVGIYVYPL